MASSGEGVSALARSDLEHELLAVMASLREARTAGELLSQASLEHRLDELLDLWIALGRPGKLKRRPPS